MARRGEKRQNTIRDVAARAGVSVSTVSRVMAGDYPVAQATKQRVQRAIKELNYVANTHARALVAGSTQTVAFIVNDVRGPAFAAAVHGAEQEAARRGRLCLVCATEGDPARELAAVHLMREQRASAVILIGGAIDDDAYRARMAQIAHSLDAAGSRLVLCGRPPLGDGIPATVVEYDNEPGAYAATAHLLSRGHRRILFLGGEPAFTTTAGRLSGYRRALEDNGVPVDPELIVTQVEFTRASGHEHTRRLLSSGPPFTAIFAETDVVAGGAMAAIFEAGLSVPEDVSLVGYDDIPLATDLRPQLTTVRVPYEELGRSAVRLALELREGRASSGSEQHAVFGTHVVVRKSVMSPARDGVRPRP
ncbi:LacI family DNA-binding transcriptional regulator [Nonomuraea sp. NPDC005650]|uniref:LacI family DNA-binding transcriptional regulator n=1 Tax=Nonomuraea sp. NPDC005650 TaxID=3157045 RepID=UPI0033B51697